MSKHTIIITLSILIIIIPFLGLPSFWKTLLIILSGLGIILHTFLLRNESSNKQLFNFDRNTDVYVENGANSNIENEEKIQNKK